MFKRIISFSLFFAIAFSFLVMPTYAGNFSGAGASRSDFFSFANFPGGGGSFSHYSSADAYAAYVSALEGTAVSSSALSTDLAFTATGTIGANFHGTWSNFYLSSTFSFRPNFESYFTVLDSGYYSINAISSFTSELFHPYTIYGNVYLGLYVYVPDSDTWSQVASRSYSSSAYTYKGVTSNGLTAVTYSHAISDQYLYSGNQYKLVISPLATVSVSASYLNVSGYIRLGAKITPVNGASDTYPSNARPAALMQAIDDYNATDGSSKYYIGSADSSGQITNVYSPNIFVESTKVFTEPVTGAQYQCTDWTYAYSTSIGVGAYRLDLKDGTYIRDGKSIRSLLLFYASDGLIIVGFEETSQQLTALGVIGENSVPSNVGRYAEFYDTYYYVIESEPEPGACIHDYTSEIITPATCTESGVVRYTCSLCGDTYTASLLPTGHDYTSEVTAESTCLTRGVITHTCSTCGDTFTEIIPALGHNYALVSDIDPTCTEEGVTTYACTLCGASYRETTPALGHDWQLIDTVEPVYDDDGNIVEVGYSLYECSRCHQQFVDYDGDGPPADMDGTGCCSSYWEWWKEAWSDFVTKLFSFFGIEIDPDADPNAPASTVGFWERIKNAFLDALASLIEKVLDFITEILGVILDLLYDLLSFFFDFLTGTVISGIGNFFSAFTDGSLFQFFQSGDGTGYALPEGVAGVFAFFSGVIMLLPWELRSLLIFGIAAMVLLGVFKLVKS